MGLFIQLLPLYLHEPKAENTAKTTEYEFAVRRKAATGEAHRSEGQTQVESLMAVLSVHH